MKVSEILDRAQVIKEETKWVKTEYLLDDLGLDNFYPDLMGVISSRHVYKWVDNNAQVGLYVYYMGKSPIAIVWKPYRKSDPRVYWINKLLKKAFQNYVMQLYCDECLDNIILDKDDDLDEYIEDIELIKYNTNE